MVNNQSAPTREFISDSLSWANTGKKILTGALIAIAGAVATYLQDTIPGIDFGQYEGIVVALNSILVNVIRNYIRKF